MTDADSVIGLTLIATSNAEGVGGEFSIFEPATAHVSADGRSLAYGGTGTGGFVSNVVLNGDVVPLLTGPHR